MSFDNEDSKNIKASIVFNHEATTSEEEEEEEEGEVTGSDDDDDEIRSQSEIQENSSDSG